MIGPILLLLAVLALVLAGYGSWRLGVAERDALEKRTALDVVEARASRLGNRLDVAFRRTWLGRRLAVRVERAGLPWRAVDVAAVLAAIGAAAFLLCTQFVTWWVAVMVAAGAVRLAMTYLDRREDQRREAFVAQLPEVARVLSNGTSAGLALRSAIRMAGDDLAAPAGPELRYLSDRLDVGTSMTDALADLYERLPSRELSLLTRTLIIQARAGGAVVTALRDMSETLEARKDLRREIRTLLAGSVFTSWIVLVLGVGALLMLNLITPGTLHRMTSTVIGQVTLALAGAIYALGFVLIRRTTRIEV
jgi:tight adherence protein B